MFSDYHIKQHVHKLPTLKHKLKDALAMYYIQQLDIHQRYNRSMKIEELQKLMILVISDVCFSITHHETHSTFFYIL